MPRDASLSNSGYIFFLVEGGVGVSRRGGGERGGDDGAKRGDTQIEGNSGTSDTKCGSIFEILCFS